MTVAGPILMAVRTAPAGDYRDGQGSGQLMRAVCAGGWCRSPATPAAVSYPAVIGSGRRPATMTYPITPQLTFLT